MMKQHKERTISVVALIVLAFGLFFIITCTEEDEGFECPEITLSSDICNAGTLSVTIDNEFLPLVPGDVFVLEGDDEGEFLRVVITVLDETEIVDGSTTRVVIEEEYSNGELIEVSHNFFAQASDGTVCYLGEDVDIYENGQIVSHDGEWRAGENGNRAGIIMPGSPEVGQAFYQEQAAGIAEDMSEVVALGESITVPAGSFSDTVTCHDYNPIDDEDPCEPERKVYVSGIGLAIDNMIQLVSY